jgi:hypothetical protein
VQVGQVVVVEQRDDRIRDLGCESRTARGELVDPDQQTEPDHVLGVGHGAGGRV